MTNAHAGLFWGELRDVYPMVSERPSLPAHFEVFTTDQPVPTFTFQASFAPMMSRFWFEDASSEHLLQLQADRIMHNWRQGAAFEREYPRYEGIRQRLFDEMQLLAKFTERERLGTLTPNQCELSYINVIALEDGRDPRISFDVVHPFLSNSKPVFSKLGMQLETQALQENFVVFDGGRPRGRVYISMSPAFRISDSKPIVQLEITVRLIPKSGSIEAAFDELDDARDLGVRTFDAFTSEIMHKAWGKR